jgi:hypothetical protein
VFDDMRELPMKFDAALTSDAIDRAQALRARIVPLQLKELWPVESEIVQVFGCRDAEIIPTLGQPASEKRQGAKSRGVRHRQCSGAMGIWRRREYWGS